MCDTVHVFTQQEIGLLWGGFRTGESSYCIIQLLEPETAIPQGCILDEFDCPLLTMVGFFCVIPSSSVCAAVSVVHKCTTTCSFLRRLHQLWFKGGIHPSTDMCLYMIGLILCTVTTSIA